MGIQKKNKKLIDETRKILKDDELKVTATCIRVPVQDSHSVHMSVTLEKEATVSAIQELFENDDRVVLEDDPQNNVYPLAINSI